jgi:uncharacterized membrane protein YdjX (TVP38/TMEM64 family)
MSVSSQLLAPTALRMLIGIAVVVIAFASTLAMQLGPNGLTQDLAAAISNIADQLGWLPFLVLQTIVVISGVLPASMVGLAAGMVYGLGPGVVLATVAVLAGALIAFALGRSLLRPFVARQLQRNARMSRLDNLVTRDGWKIVCLLRASPIMPFAATSYGLGLSSISVTGYLVGTLASLPALSGYVFIGTLAREGLTTWSSNSDLRRALIIVGIMATMLLIVRIGWLAAKCGLLPEGLLAAAGKPNNQTGSKPDHRL